MDDNFGYEESPRNGDGIIRAATSGQIRSWDMPRELKALEKVQNDWGNEYPGIYLLLDQKSRKVYIGEAKDLYSRLSTHFRTPDEKIKNFDRVIILNDGRSARHSLFNDAVIRKSLEAYLNRLFKINKWTVVSQAEEQEHNPTQKSKISSLTEELNSLLRKKNLIAKLIEAKGQEEILEDELRRLLKKSKHEINKWSAKEAVIDGEKTYIRPGSDKRPRGWQITFRDRFKAALKSGKGFLLVPRNGVLLIPLQEIQKVIEDPASYNQNTIDIYIDFKEDEVTLSYTTNSIKVTQFKLEK